MSKLAKLKEWYTIPEAAKFISQKLGEEVSEADILRMGLDCHLTLSIYIVGHVYARQGRIESSPNARMKIDEIMSALEDSNSEIIVKATETMGSITNEKCEKHKKITRICGLWDLPLIGNEIIDIEMRYIDLINGPELDIRLIDGAYVKKIDGEIYTLLDNFNNYEDTKAHTKEPYDNPYNFFPAARIPEDSILVLRTDIMNDFIRKIMFLDNTPSRNKAATLEKSKKTYCNLTEQREEYRKEAYAFLSNKVIAIYKAGAMQYHHKPAKKIFEAYKRGDYNLEMTEAVGGLPRRKLAYDRFKKEVVKKMKQEGFDRWIFGMEKT